jgi:hydrogenase 3 maturation protease
VSGTHVVCFGNALHGDDAFGLHVHRRLRALPTGASVFDAGTAGLDALGYFEGCARAVIVDAVRAGGAPGTVHRLAGSDLAPAGGELSLHDLGIASLLAALEAVSPEPPEVVVIGAEVGDVTPFTDGLSPPVAAAVGEAVRLVLAEIQPFQPPISASPSTPRAAPSTGWSSIAGE